ncbi:hypothetical protein M885DRAFT_625552, partial [Pelagophyceae sp. CCMP2097]
MATKTTASRTSPPSKRAANFAADDAATFGSDACNKAPTANGVSDGINEAAHEAPKAAPKKVANAAPNNKFVSEGIDEDAYEAPKAAHARPQYRTHVKNIDEGAHEAPKAAHARPQYRTQMFRAPAALVVFGARAGRLALPVSLCLFGASTADCTKRKVIKPKGACWEAYKVAMVAEFQAMKDSPDADPGGVMTPQHWDIAEQI